MLRILVDSKEQSITAARQYFDDPNNQHSGELDVQCIRHAKFSEAFLTLFTTENPGDQIVIAMDYIGQEELDKVTGKVPDNLKTCSVGYPVVKLISYDCFDHLKNWCDQHGFEYTQNQNERRDLDRAARNKIHKYLYPLNSKQERSEREDSGQEDSGQELPKKYQYALERIWVQYQLMRTIISLQSLNVIAKQLIIRQYNPGAPSEAGITLDEFRAAFQYFTLKEPDMVGGTYFDEQEEEKGKEKKKNVIDQLRERIKQIAATNFNVLIQGDSGSGKESVAWAIHELSQRRDKPFRTINCAGFSDELLESELFGHEKGAFTGAIKPRKGILREADGGTVFLDELPDMGPKSQAKVLRLLESGEFRPVGADGGNLYVDVRIIAAGQCRLLNQPERIREDLKARIGQLTIKLFSLREVEEESPGTLLKIVNALLERFTWTTVYRPDDPNHTLTPKDIRDFRNRLERDVAKRNLLIGADWQKSNVRQLKNFISHWLALGDGEFSRLSQENKVSGEDCIQNDKDLNPNQVKEFGRSIPDVDQIVTLEKFMKKIKKESIKGSETAGAKFIFQLYLRVIANDILRGEKITLPSIAQLSKITGINKYSLGKFLK